MDSHKPKTFINIKRRNSNAADTTDLSNTSVAPQFHLGATGTHIFSKAADTLWTKMAAPCPEMAALPHWCWVSRTPGLKMASQQRKGLLCVCVCVCVCVCLSVCLHTWGYVCECVFYPKRPMLSIGRSEFMLGRVTRESGRRRSKTTRDKTGIKKIQIPPHYQSMTHTHSHVVQTHTETYIWHIHAQPNE